MRVHLRSGGFCEQKNRSVLADCADLPTRSNGLPRMTQNHLLHKGLIKQGLSHNGQDALSQVLFTFAVFVYFKCLSSWTGIYYLLQFKKNFFFFFLPNLGNDHSFKEGINTHEFFMTGLIFNSLIQVLLKQHLNHCEPWYFSFTFQPSDHSLEALGLNGAGVGGPRCLLPRQDFSPSCH